MYKKANYPTFSSPPSGWLKNQWRPFSHKDSPVPPKQKQRGQYSCRWKIPRDCQQHLCKETDSLNSAAVLVCPRNYPQSTRVISQAHLQTKHMKRMESFNPSVLIHLSMRLRMICAPIIYSKSQGKWRWPDAWKMPIMFLHAVPHFLLVALHTRGRFLWRYQSYSQGMNST